MPLTRLQRRESPKRLRFSGTACRITDYAGAWTCPRVGGAGRPGLTWLRRQTPMSSRWQGIPGFRTALEKFEPLTARRNCRWSGAMNHFSKCGMKDRVYGRLSCLHCLEATGGEFSHFLVGGSENCWRTLQRKLREKFPGIRIAGAYSPPFGSMAGG